jgi:hypothetical protein
MVVIKEIQVCEHTCLILLNLGTGEWAFTSKSICPTSCRSIS